MGEFIFTLTLAGLSFVLGMWWVHKNWDVYSEMSPGEEAMWVWGISLTSLLCGILSLYLKWHDIWLHYIVFLVPTIGIPFLLGVAVYNENLPQPKPEEPKNPAPPEPPKKEESAAPDYSIPVETKCSHALVIGGSGSGKTTLLLEMIAEDLEAACSLVVFDSEGDIYERLLKIDHPNTVLVDPVDHEPVRLSLFPDAENEERRVAKATELLTFALDAINNPLTPPMKNMLRFVVRLCLKTPNPSLQTLREVFNDFSKFAKYVDQLPETPQAFFKEEFQAQKLTRESLTQRIYPLADSPFAKMFTGVQTLDLKKALDDGTLILINSSNHHLGNDGYVFFTRFMVYLLYQIIQERDPLQDNMPVYLYLDEAKDVVDENIVTMLEKARKRRMGLTLSFLTEGGIPQAHAHSVLESTAIKAIRCGIGGGDAKKLAAYMDDNPNALTRKRPYHFYFYVANKYARYRETDRTALAKLPKRKDVDALKEQNRDLYSGRLAAGHAAPPDDAHAIEGTAQRVDDDMERLNKA